MTKTQELITDKLSILKCIVILQIFIFIVELLLKKKRSVTTNHFVGQTDNWQISIKCNQKSQIQCHHIPAVGALPSVRILFEFIFSSNGAQSILFQSKNRQYLHLLGTIGNFF